MQASRKPSLRFEPKVGRAETKTCDGLQVKPIRKERDAHERMRASHLHEPLHEKALPGPTHNKAGSLHDHYPMRKPDLAERTERSRHASDGGNGHNSSTPPTQRGHPHGLFHGEGKGGAAQLRLAAG